MPFNNHHIHLNTCLRYGISDREMLDILYYIRDNELVPSPWRSVRGFTAVLVDNGLIVRKPPPRSPRHYRVGNMFDSFVKYLISREEREERGVREAVCCSGDGQV